MSRAPVGSKRTERRSTPTPTYQSRFRYVANFPTATPSHMSEIRRWMSVKMPQIGAAHRNEVDAETVRPLNKDVNLFERLVRDESGATAVEYSLILGGIAAAIIVMIYVFGDKVNNLYNNTQSQWP